VTAGPTTVRLLGRPRLERAGAALPPPPGRKAWALLALLLLSPAPASRRQLTDLLFTEAADPLAALRWTTAALRRSLGDAAQLGGDPLELRWTAHVDVDVDRLGGHATWSPGLDGELLEGFAFPDSPAFETWLLVERRRLAGGVDALLRETAVAALSSGRAPDAVTLAERLARRQPFDEGAQALLARALAATGDAFAAREHVVATAARFRRELGHPPSAALAAAAQITLGRPLARPSVGGAGVRALLEAGRAATGAGAVDAGVDCLRRAVEDAERLGEASLAAAANLALGSALVHALRGRDEEGSVALHAAVREAEAAGDGATAATACRELGFVDVQAGRRGRAARWLDRATALADGDDRELAAVLGVRGMDLSDQGSTAEALEALGESADRARSAGHRRQAGWSLSIAGRAHLLRGEDDDAARALAESTALVQEERWMAFLPWPQALQAELDIRQGRLDDAASTLDSSWQLACQVEDPCWEGMAARGLGVLAAHAGRRDAATTWLQDAHRRCTRWPDRYVWVQAHILDAVCASGLPGAHTAVTELLDLAGRTGMRGFVARAQEHAGRFGAKTVDLRAGPA
jgi:DNA-binding SARP family transcriptional activator